MADFDFFLKLTEFMHLEEYCIDTFLKNLQNATSVLESAPELVAHSFKYPLWSEIFYQVLKQSSHSGSSPVKHFRGQVGF